MKSKEIYGRVKITTVKPKSQNKEVFDQSKKKKKPVADYHNQTGRHPCLINLVTKVSDKDKNYRERKCYA